MIAKEVGVDAVVEGTITHSGDKVRITAQLIRAGDDRVPAPQRPTNFRSDL